MHDIKFKKKQNFRTSKKNEYMTHQDRKSVYHHLIFQYFIAEAMEKAQRKM